MGYRGHVRIVNKIEYSDEIGNNEYTAYELIKELIKLEKKYDTDLLIYEDEYRDNLELSYINLEEVVTNHPESCSKELKKIFEYAKNSEDCIKTDCIVVDWF